MFDDRNFVFLENMPSSSSSPSSDEDKLTSGEEDVTPKASPAAVSDDDSDRTLTMPSTSQGYQVCFRN